MVAQREVQIIHKEFDNNFDYCHLAAILPHWATDIDLTVILTTPLSQGNCREKAV
jgi:hypothetical protein